MSPTAIKTVTIVGGGTAGWMAAAVLARALNNNVEVRLVESEMIGTVGVGEATIPQIRLLIHLLGIDEHAFLAATNGTIKLGIEFANWGRVGERYIHAFGNLGQSLGMSRFWAYWLRANGTANPSSLWDYSLNAVAAKEDRYEPVERIENTQLGGLVRAYHFDAGLFAGYLRQIAEDAGVIRTEGTISHASQKENGWLEAVHLENGQSVSGDLFIDCSGFRGLLIGQTLDVDYIDWSDWLPCDRAFAVASDPLSPLPPYTRATAHSAGWQWRIPLQTRTGNGHVFCSAYTSEDEARNTLLEHIVGELHGEPRLLKFTTGRRARFWDKNCIALGLSAGFMEPLESTSIHLVQSGISRLLSLFPAHSINAAEIDAFNRQTTFEYERIRDFLILHYFANHRQDSEFWIDRANMSIPDSLAAKIDVFKSHGRLFREGDELFTEPGWLQVLIGQNILPSGYDPLANQLPDTELERFLSTLRRVVGGAASRLMPHSDYIERHCKTAVSRPSS